MFGELDILSIAIVVIVVVIAVITFTYVRDYLHRRGESYRRIKAMANIDELTHLYKRKFFYTLFDAELDRAKRYGRDLSCAIIEIDNFNELLEKYGEQFCDLVVQDIGEIFTDDTRIHDICARYDEYSFASLMPESGLEPAKHVCKRLRGSVERTNFVIEETDEEVNVTVSVGLISCKEHLREDIDTDTILEMANEALETAKKNGGNRVECYSASNS